MTTGIRGIERMKTMQNQNDSEPDKSSTPTPSQTDSDRLIEDLHREIEQKRQVLGIKVEGLKPLPVKAVQVPPALTAEELAERERRAAERQRMAVGMERRHKWESLVGSRGSRYGTCSLETFDAQTDLQKSALATLRQYCAEIRENLKEGRGVLLYGPRGTGKDHLAMAVCREAIKADIRVKWQNGMDLFGDIRDMMDDDGSDSERLFIQRMIQPEVLYISDPLPPVGNLTQFQAAMLFRILDARYSRSKPLVCTINVSGRNELDERIGPQNSDRILHGAIPVWCNWESYRKPARDVKPQ